MIQNQQRHYAGNVSNFQSPFDIHNFNKHHQVSPFVNNTTNNENY